MSSKRYPVIPLDVEEDLSLAVRIIVDSFVPVKMIKLFGSLHTGHWRRYSEKGKRASDIDLALYMYEDKRYSTFARLTLFLGNRPIAFANSPERKELAGLLKNHSRLSFAKRYSLHIMTPSDIKKMRRDNSFIKDQRDVAFIKSLKTARVLYRN